MSSSLRVNTIVPSTGTNVAIGTANGTVTFTDSVNFVLGTGSSIFSPASNTLTFGTNDAERLRITSAGSVGIGTDTPGTTKLKIETGSGTRAISLNAPTNGTYITFETAGTAYADIGAEKGVVGSGSADTPVINARGSRDISFRTNSSERLRITSAGNLGIGDASPTKPLTVGTTTPVILLDDQSSRTLEIRGPSTTHNATVLTTSTHDLLLGTNNAERFRITSAGRIGINQTSPEAMLQVDYDEGNSEVGLRLRAYNASGSKTWQLSEVNGNAGVFSIRNQTNSTEGLEIHADGHLRVPTGDLRVGDNTDSNAGTKTISVGSVSSGSGGIGIFANPTNGNSWVQFGDGTSGSDQYRGYMNYQHADDSLRFGTAGSERFRIDSSGRLLLNSGTDVRIELGTTGSTGTNNRNHLRGDGANMKYNCCSGGGHFFEANGGERMRISSNGHVNIGDGYIVSNSGLHVGRSSGGTAAGESIIAATMGNDSTMVSALLTVKNAGNRGAQGASGGSPLAKFEFNNGTAFEIDKYGRRTLQYQPACKISIDSNNQGGGNSAQTGNTIVPFNSTAYGYNIGNHFNTTNHIFTCPLAGRYLVLLSLNVIGDNIVYIYKNGTVNMGGEYRSNPTGVWEHCELSGVIDCSANDTIKAHSYLISSSGGRKFNGGNGGSYWDTLSIYYLG